MKTKIQSIDPEHPNLTHLQEAADLLNAGELVAFPTETVYGLGANAFDAMAVAKIFAAKERPAADPLIVHIYSLAQLEQIAANVPPLAWELAHRFWPGPLTLILPRHPNIPRSVSAGLDTVAVRMPNHKIPHALFKLGDLAVAAPSANLFTRPSPTTAQHVYDDLHGRLPLILDGGSATIGVESTVLDLTQERPVILRPGGLPRESLTAVLPNVTYSPRFSNLVGQNAEPSAPSPGTHLKHYAPNVALRLYSGQVAAVLARIVQDTAVYTAQGQRVGLLLAEEDVVAVGNTAVYTATLGSLHDLPEMARTLFAHLRQLERADVDIVLTRTFSEEGLGLALRDRLIRATEGQIIPV
ncbi:MAG: threonylcarbamoyl-AMP synthase [Anaerolineales bacterium]|nr:threonylcarbamoyl-AMP synthase [Anaerolineales bacterium]